LVNSQLLFQLSYQEVFLVWLNLKQDKKKKISKSKEEVKIRNNCIQKSGGERVNNTKICINKICFL
jgi:hypothetical protein